MNFKKIIAFLYKLSTTKIMLWNANNKIQLFVPESIPLTEADISFIEIHRTEILYLLQKHQINSRDTACNLPIMHIEAQSGVLSFAQERLWFIDKYEEGTNAYNVPMRYELSEGIDLNVLKKSIENIIERHEVLRSVIKEDSNGNSYQIVLDSSKTLFDIKILTCCSNDILEENLEKDGNHIYDLSAEYPVIVKIYQLLDKPNNVNNPKYYLSIVIHHIAFDGWSTDIFLRELGAYYRYYKAKTEGRALLSLNLPELNIQYKDFALWQRSYLTGEVLENQLSYWKNKLDGFETLNLVIDKVRPIEIDYEGRFVDFELDKELSSNLKELAKRLKVSLYSLLLSCYYLMLRSYTGQNDIVIGTPVANRHYPQVENLIGFFVNSIALRVKVNPTATLKEFIKQVGDEVLEAQLHQDLPFEKLVDALSIVKDTSRNPIFQVMFGVQSFGGSNKGLLTASNEEAGYTSAILKSYKSEKNHYNIAKFDITTFIDDSDSNGILRGSFNYAVSLYEEATIKGFIETYKKILEQIPSLLLKGANEKSQKIADLKYLSGAAYKTIINTYNETDKPYPDNKTLHQLFEEQVEKTPGNIAVVYEDTRLTYRELNERANQLASYVLLNYNIKPDTLIILCLDRSEHMLIAILAALKAGAAYVPIDPNYPDERLRYILEDTQKANGTLGVVETIILTNEIYGDRLRGLATETKPSTYSISLVVINSLPLIKELATYSSTLNPHGITTSVNLAYIIYTSGTTGNPKGVMVEHRSVVNVIFAQHSYLRLHEHKEHLVFGLLVNYVLDASVPGIFLPLIFGHTIVVSPELTTINPSDFIQKKLINIAAIPSKVLTLLDQNSTESLQKVVIGGETADSHTIKQILHMGLKLIQEYGATETSIVSTCRNIDIDTKPFNIGAPISNSKAYVLLSSNMSSTSCSSLTPLPIGAIGELYIGGVGLARGYLNQSDLTSEKFISNPFQTEEEKNDKTYGARGRNSRLYKTGDLVRWLPDGNLEYIGRTDFQVKIRGYRIELGEIETAISSYSGVKQCVVLAKEHKKNSNGSDTTKYLVAYYSSSNPRERLDEESILSYLEQKLPAYMVPRTFVHLEVIPLTANGKLDTKALPDIEWEGNKDKYVAPRNELESKICAIFSEILGFEANKISVCDDFFRLGGNSILAIKLMSRINQEIKEGLLGVNCRASVSDIFKHRSIEKLAHHLVCTSDIGSSEKSVVIKKAMVIREEDQVLSFAQERLWFIDKYEEGTNAYNVPMRYELSEGIDLNVLKKSIENIIERHEVLRSVIKEDSNGNSYQIVLDSSKTLFDIKILTCCSNDILEENLEKDGNHIYDLSAEYPVIVKIYQLLDKPNNVNNPKYYLSIVIHHIAFDGWSTDIFLRELGAYYRYYKAKTEGRALLSLNLPELNIQYKDFALWQRSYLTGEVLENQLSYWKNKLDGFETLNLVIDKVRPIEIDYEGRFVDFELDKELSSNLKELAKRLKVSLYSLLLSCYYLMLRSYTGQNDIVIGTPVANRHYPQVENLIGFFVNSIALRVKVNPTATLKEFIKQVGDEVLEAQLHQDLPFEKLVDALSIVKDTSRNPIFQVMFGVQSFGGSNKGLLTASNEEAGYTSAILKSYKSEKNHYNIAKFDITTFIDDSDSNGILRGSFNYAVSLYEEATIRGFIETYKKILEQIPSLLLKGANEKSQKIADLKYLSGAAYKTIINTYNETDKPYPDNKTLHQLFEEQVEKTPGNIAVVYEDTRLTYRELNERANQLANYVLLNYNIKPDTLIILCLDRSEHMLIAILAALKAGAAYVPIDPNYPDERLRYILEDTSAKVLLTNEIHEPRLKEIIKQKNNLPIKILAVDSQLTKTKLELQIKDNTNTETKATDLAYVIYTSGTTGKPKGVMVEHRSVVNLAIVQAKEFGFCYSQKEIKNCLWYSNYVFDAHVWELYSTILHGCTIYIINNNIRQDINLLGFYIQNNLIDIALIPPVLLDNKNIFKLSTLVVGGDTTDYSIINHYLSNKVKVINAYGPTEITVMSNTYTFVNNSEATIIGTPIVNTKCYVLDINLSPVPIGAIGELYIGGAGLARGYLNRLDLTAENFILNPFQTEEEKIDKIYDLNGRNARLYKTGDLVRWLPEGNLEYIGRNDSQVKIRGHRIELKEIENALLNYQRITQSIVLTKEYKDQEGSSNKYLIGYYVSNNKLNEQHILKYLNSKLPDYTVPSALVHLIKLPITINGKLDTKALPEPDLTSTDTYVAPRNKLEKVICQIWAKVLGLYIEKIGINDNFFRLGGNSILVIKLLSYINKQVNINNDHLNVKIIYNHPTISKLAELIQNNVTAVDVSISFSNESILDNSITPISSISLSLEKEQVNTFLTGATGFVGVHLLYELGQNPKINKIFCLVMANTESEALNRIYEALLRYNLSTDNFHKIIPILGTISEKFLGLGEEQFEEIADKTNTISPQCCINGPSSNI